MEETMTTMEMDEEKNQKEKNTNTEENFGYEYEGFGENKKNKDKEEVEEEEDNFEVEAFSNFMPFQNYNVQEGFGIDIGGAIRDAFERPFRPVIDFVNNFPKTLAKPFEPLLEFINKVKRTFIEIGNRIQLLKTSFDEVGKAIELQFVNLGKTIKTEMDDVGDLIKGGANCGVHFVTNFRSCLIYYGIDFLLHLLYSIFWLFPIWLVETISGFSLQPYVGYLLNMIHYINDIFKSITGYSFLNFPPSVIEKCYSCKNVNFNKLVEKIQYDNYVTFPKWMNEPKQLFNKAGSDFKNVFRPM